MIDTPIYPDIYSFPGNRYHQHHLHHHKKYEIDDTYLVQPSKSVLIMDSFGNARYEVSLSSTLSTVALPDDTRAYKVTVTQFIYSPGEDPTISAFLTIPDEGYETDYFKAQHDFDTCVQRYDSLVKSEMKDFRDIDIYKDKIGYEVLDPECCKTCKYAVLAKEPSMHRGHMKLECHNPENQQAFNYANTYPPFPNRDAHRYDGWKKLPWQKYIHDHEYDCRLDEHHPYPIFPRVDPMGHCNKYNKNEKES